MQTGILAETHAMYFCVDAERWNDAHHEIEELIQRQVQVPTDCVCVCALQNKQNYKWTHEL